MLVNATTHAEQHRTAARFDAQPSWRLRAEKRFTMASSRGIVRSLIDIYEVRFGAMPEELRAIIEDSHDDRVLCAWLRRAGKCTADEICTATYDHEFLRVTQDVVDAWRQEAIREGIEQGTARSLIVYEARFGAMPEELRARVEGIRDASAVRAWLKLAATRAADDLAAAIRAHAS